MSCSNSIIYGQNNSCSGELPALAPSSFGDDETYQISTNNMLLLIIGFLFYWVLQLRMSEISFPSLWK